MMTSTFIFIVSIKLYLMVVNIVSIKLYLTDGEPGNTVSEIKYAKWLVQLYI